MKISHSFPRRCAALASDPLILGIGYWMLPHIGGRQTSEELAILGGAAAALATPVCFQVAGAYRVMHQDPLLTWILRAWLGLCVVAAALLSAAFFTKGSAEFSRLLALQWGVFSASALVLSRLAISKGSEWLQSRGFGLQSVVAIGRAESLARLRRRLENVSEHGLKLLAEIEWEPGSTIPRDNLREATKSNVDRVLICGRLEDSALIEASLRALIDRPLRVQLIPDLSGLPVFAPCPGEVCGDIALDLTAAPIGELAIVMKRAEDLVLGTIMLVLMAVPMAIVALAIKLTSPGPVLFVQERHGLNGRVFRMFKFRSMRAAGARDSRERRSGPIGDATPDDFKQAQKDDPRITWIGRIIRRTSIDELPQIFNVLLGDMSLVGPRPQAIRHNEQFTESIDELMRRHYMKPGITGLAQICGARGETRTVDDMRRRIELDLSFIKRWSIWLDLRILAVTAVKGWINRSP